LFIKQSSQSSQVSVCVTFYIIIGVALFLISRMKLRAVRTIDSHIERSATACYTIHHIESSGTVLWISLPQKCQQQANKKDTHAHNEPQWSTSSHSFQLLLLIKGCAHQTLLIKRAHLCPLSAFNVSMPPCLQLHVWSNPTLWTPWPEKPTKGYHLPVLSCVPPSSKRRFHGYDTRYCHDVTIVYHFNMCFMVSLNLPLKFLPLHLFQLGILVSAAPYSSWMSYNYKKKIR
jgi:hypothetical protein